MKEYLGLKRLRSGKKRPEGDVLVALSRSREEDRNKRAVAVFNNWKAAGFPIVHGNPQLSTDIVEPEFVPS
jgi:hypothetical protein